MDCGLLARGLKEWRIELSELQQNQFVRYYEMLIKKNQVMNLTAITEWEEVQVKHFLDSLAWLKLMPVERLKEKKFIDVGTGAGFPGIPLKIMCPGLEVVLADSLNKRLAFLNEVIEELELQKITTVHGRAEELGQNPKYRESFDYCVSRAVANLSTLSEYCIPFLKTGGSFVAYKSGEIEDELNMAKKAIQILGGKINYTESFRLPNTDISRTLVVIEKEKTTSPKYPRKAGMPGKQPL